MASAWLKIDNVNNLLALTGGNHATFEREKDQINTKIQEIETEKKEYENFLKKREEIYVERAHIESEILQAQASALYEWERARDKWQDTKTKAVEKAVQSIWENADALLNHIFKATQDHEGDMSVSELSFVAGADLSVYSFEDFDGEHWFSALDIASGVTGYIRHDTLRHKFTPVDLPIPEPRDVGPEPIQPDEAAIASQFPLPEIPPRPQIELNFEEELAKLQEMMKALKPVTAEAKWDIVKQEPLLSIKVPAINSPENQVSIEPIETKRPEADQQITSTPPAPTEQSSESHANVPIMDQISSSQSFKPAPSEQSTESQTILPIANWISSFHSDTPVPIEQSSESQTSVPTLDRMSSSQSGKPTTVRSSSTKNSVPSQPSDPTLSSWIKAPRKDDLDEGLSSVNDEFSSINNNAASSESRKWAPPVRKAKSVKKPEAALSLRSTLSNPAPVANEAPTLVQSDSSSSKPNVEVPVVEDGVRFGEEFIPSSSSKKKLFESRQEVASFRKERTLTVATGPAAISGPAKAPATAEPVLDARGFADPEFTKYTLEELVNGTAPHVDPQRKHEYLTEEEFSRVFGCTMNQFNKFNDFKRDNMLKNTKLF